jgi:serine/threonine protein kinase/tetratricopeptide (TPR) repeat protein
MAADSSERFVLLNHLAEDFAARYRRGERPSLKEYMDLHPELADDIQEYFPAMVEMEQAKDDRQEVLAPPAQGPLPAWERLGDFRILREIGHGGMGVVYEAEQVSLGRRVALKVLPQRLLLEARTKQRFEREAKAAARLHHTNIVPVFGVGEHEGLPYFVMQFIQGLGLDQVLEELKSLQADGKRGEGSSRPSAGELRVSRRDMTAVDVARSLMTGAFVPPIGEESDAAVTDADMTVDHAASAAHGDPQAASTPAGGRLSHTFTAPSSSVVLPGSARQRGGKPATYWQSVARIGVQVADALDYAHKQGIQHRDIKPSNLLLDTTGTVWVTDFGLAKADDQQNLTHTGDVLGTLRYMPPEAFEGRSDARGDVYSLGLTLYELIAMRPAFDEKDRNRLIKEVTSSEPVRLDRQKSDVPRDLVTVIHKAIDRDPGHRYGTAGELAADLQRFLDDEPVQARRQTQGERYVRWARRNPGIAALGGVLTAVLVVATVASLLAARHFNRLRLHEAEAANGERAARRDAELLRGAAERSKQAAEESRERAQAALATAEANYAKARAAVNDYLTAVSDDPRLKEPGLSTLRATLLQSALGFYQQFLKERAQDPALRRELAQVYFKVGQIYRDLGQTQPAGQANAQALRLYEALARDAPNDPDFQYGLARCHYNSFSFSGRERAIAILEKLVRPDDPRYQADLGNAYSDAGLGTNGDRARTFEYLRKALTVRERLVRLRPDDPDARLGLSASLNNIAVQVGNEHPAEQNVLYRRACEQGEAAYRLRPMHPNTIRFLTIEWNNVASTARTLGRADDVVAALRRRAEVLDRWARDNPDLPGAAAQMVHGYTSLAGELKELGRLDEAARVVRQGRDRAAEVTTDDGRFFGTLISFHLNARAVAEARAKDSAEARPDVERAALAAVAAIRNYVLTGWWDPQWMRTNPAVVPLQTRRDYQELIARVEALMKADQLARNARTAPADKVVARQECLATLEALGAPEPTARHVRRALAQARQNLAQAFLDAGRASDARSAVDEALEVRRRLLEESPSSEPLRTDLAQSQSAAGDLFAAAGGMNDAKPIWVKALATLSDGLQKNSNSIPLATARADTLAHVADQYGRLGLWELALECERPAFEGQLPTAPATWYQFGSLLAAAGDSKALQALASRAVVPLGLEKDDREFLNLSRVFLLSPELAAVHREALRQVIERVKSEERDWPSWCQGLAHVRLGQAGQGLALLQRVMDSMQRLPALAIALHQMGRTRAAQEALEQADAAADQLVRDAVVADVLKIPDANWQDWLLFRVLRREAHEAIHGKPMAESPYDRLFRGRLLHTMDQPQQAEAEFTAAALLRPEDTDLWLTRARVFAKLGWKERASADLVRAQQLKAGDPRTWIETGRLLAELGEEAQADTAFARAAALGKGELSRFLEAGWWVAGPYPDRLDQSCPPELFADASKPVAAVGRPGNLKWQAVATNPVNGDINFGSLFSGAGSASFYALAYVYADRDRTASLHFFTGGDMRLWVNGKLVCAGSGTSKSQGTVETSVPIVLCTGRNQVLLKIQAAHAWCECQFEDAPGRRAYLFKDLGLWREAALAFAEADRRAPLEPFRAMFRVRCLLADRQYDEARRVFAQAVLRHDQTPNESARSHLGWACPLPPEKGRDRDQRVILQQKVMDRESDMAKHFWLGHAYFRAARFDEAEKSIRVAIASADRLWYYPLLASTLYHLGRADEANKVLQAAEERSAKLVKDALAAHPYRTAQPAFDELVFQSMLPEARMLIRGTDSGPTADQVALLAKAKARLVELERADDFVRLTEMHPNQPRLWIEEGRRLGQLNRWDEAAKAFARAVEPPATDPNIWRERGRAYADLGKWDEAAADLCRALDLTAEPRPNFPSYPWAAGRSGADELIAGSRELFDRATKVRPKDATLSARRVEHFASAGRWAEAKAALQIHLSRFPDDWWASCLLAKLHLLEGNVDAYREVCKRALERFTGRTEDDVLVSIARTALLAPAHSQADPLIGKLVEDADQEADRGFWLQATAALAEYRRGDEKAALERLDTHVTPLPDFANTQALAETVRALACQKSGRTADARAALARAQSIVARERPRPDQGWAFGWDWHNWVQVEVLVREAESLIPADPATASAATASPAQEANARRDRKARAARLSTDFALALIRVGVGPKETAEAELRAVVAAREEIAKEEPTNPDYRADLMASRTAVGSLLVDAGRIGEAEKELSLAVVSGTKLLADRPADRQVRLDLAAAQRGLFDVASKMNRPADAVRALRAQIDLLGAVRKDDPKSDELKNRMADAEYHLGEWYARLGLLAAAAEVMRVDEWPRTVDPWRQIRAGQLRRIAGDTSSLEKVADGAQIHSGQATNPTPGTLAAVAVAHALAPRPKDNRDHLLELARKSAEGATATDPRQAIVGAWKYRVGRFDDAIRHLDTPQLRENAWSKAVIAMAYHELHQTDRAREWLERLSDHVTNHVRTQMAAGGVGGDATWERLVDSLCLYHQAHQLIIGKPPDRDPLVSLYGALGHYRLGEHEMAEADFKAGTETRPDDPLFWLARGRAYAAAGRAEQAAADLVKADSLARQALAEESAGSRDRSISPRALVGLIQLERGNARAALASLGQEGAGTPAWVADDYLVLALAHQRLGEIDQACRVYRQGVAAMKPARDDTLLRDLVRAALRDDLVRAALRQTAGSSGAEAEEVLAAVVGDPPAALAEAIQRQPEHSGKYLDRAAWYGGRGLWRKAAEDYAAAYRVQPGAHEGMVLAIVLAQIGQADRYRDLCRQLLDRFAATSWNMDADATLKACCLLGPDPIGEPARLARLAEVAAAGDPTQPWYEFFLLAKGMYEYRTGRFDVAVTSCRASRRQITADTQYAEPLAAAAGAIEAMALERSGDAAGARAALVEAKKLIDGKVLVLSDDRFDDSWINWLVAQRFYGEAESLFAGNKEPRSK